MDVLAKRVCILTDRATNFRRTGKLKPALPESKSGCGSR